MLQKIDGKRCLVLDDKVKGAFLVTFGDTDRDGKVGLRAVALVDIPFDGDDLPDPVFDSGEVEDIPFDILPERVSDALGWLGAISEGVLGFAKKFVK